MDHLNDAPEDEKTTLPYTPPQLMVLEMTETESNQGFGGDGGGQQNYTHS